MFGACVVVGLSVHDVVNMVDDGVVLVITESLSIVGLVTRMIVYHRMRHD